MCFIGYNGRMDEERQNGQTTEEQAPQPGPIDHSGGTLDLSHAGVKRNDIISGRVQRVAVDGSKHDVRARLGIDNGQIFEVAVNDGASVRCVLADIIQTSHAMKATQMGTGSVDATQGDDPISLVLFRKE